MGDPNKNTRRLNLTIRESLHRQFKVVCSLRGKTMLAEAERLIEDCVDSFSAGGNPYPQMVARQIDKEAKRRKEEKC